MGLQTVGYDLAIEQRQLKKSEIPQKVVYVRCVCVPAKSFRSFLTL